MHSFNMISFTVQQEFSLQSLSSTISSLLQRAHTHSAEHFQQAVRVVYRAFLDSALGKETQASINVIIHAPNSALSQKVRSIYFLFFSVFHSSA